MTPALRCRKSLPALLLAGACTVVAGVAQVQAEPRAGFHAPGSTSLVEAGAMADASPLADAPAAEHVPAPAAVSHVAGYYTVRDTAPFGYRSISITGTPLALTDDGEANITLPFAFRLFDTVSSDLRVGNNGGILFANTGSDLWAGNVPLPTATIPMAILPLWDDLDTETGAVFWEVLGTAPNRVAVVEWFQRPHFPGPGTGHASFQVLLYEGSNQIRFQYLDLEFGSPAFDFGASATVGLNKDASTAVQVSFDSPVLANGQAILFTPLREYAVDDEAPFGYLPINAIGTPLDLTDDGEANITLPFEFRLFGVASSQLRVGNNGGILFGADSGDLSSSNVALPTDTLPMAILPFWDDLDSETGNVYWLVLGTAPRRVAIIEWHQRPHFPGPGVGNVTFQVFLFEGSNQILFQYLDLDFGAPTFDLGASATVGLNLDARTALQVSFNTASLANGQAILFTPLFDEYADRARFELVAPALACEDFSGTLALPGQIVAFAAPLNSTTASAVFPAGAIVPGVEFRDDPLNDEGGGSPTGLVVAVPPVSGFTQIAVLANTFLDAFVIHFDPAVNAAGMDLHHAFSESAVQVQAFDPTGALIGTIDRSASAAGGFWGFVSPRPVARIRLLSPKTILDGAEGVGNLCFGRGVQIFGDGFEGS
jgi:hypothetical protein